MVSICRTGLKKPLPKPSFGRKLSNHACHDLRQRKLEPLKQCKSDAGFVCARFLYVIWSFLLISRLKKKLDSDVVNKQHRILPSCIFWTIFNMQKWFSIYEVVPIPCYACLRESGTMSTKPIHELFGNHDYGPARVRPEPAEQIEQSSPSTTPLSRGDPECLVMFSSALN